MKVGLMVYGDLEQLSGGYLYDRMLVRELRRRGHHVNVFPLHRDPCTERDEHADRKVRSWMNEQDIVVQDELCHPSLLGLNASRERSVVALVHNLSACLASSNETVHAMERSFLKGVDAVICTSHATLAACRSLHPLLPPATVAYPGRDHVLPRPRLPGEAICGYFMLGTSIRSRAWTSYWPPSPNSCPSHFDWMWWAPSSTKTSSAPWEA